MNILNLVKYPWTAGVISIIWFGSALLLIGDKSLPVYEIVVINMVVSIVISVVGFRVEK